MGADLKERRGFDNDDLRRQRLAFKETFAALLELPVPVIAAVDGLRWAVAANWRCAAT